MSRFFRIVVYEEFMRDEKHHVAVIGEMGINTDKPEEFIDKLNAVHTDIFEAYKSNSNIVPEKTE